MNSFPEPEIRVNFLNKFYQCLMAGRMPHKVKNWLYMGQRIQEKQAGLTFFLALFQCPK